MVNCHLSHCVVRHLPTYDSYGWVTYVQFNFQRTEITQLTVKLPFILMDAKYELQSF